MNFVESRAAKRRAFLASFLTFYLLLNACFFTACTRRPSANDEFVRLMNLGKSQYESGQADKAIAAYQQALAFSPTNPDAHLNLANAYLLAGQSENALKEAREVLSLDTNSAAALYVAGCANLRLRQFDEAVKDLQQAKDIDKTVNAVSYQL